MHYLAKDPDYIKASNLRMDFFSHHIIRRNTSLYKTTVERDWAYVALREYRYLVEMKAAGWGFFVGNAAYAATLFLRKKMMFWPFAATVPAYMYAKNYFFFKHNKRLFDMCNVGEEYELGAARNEVLRECNRIMDVEDF